MTQSRTHALDQIRSVLLEVLGAQAGDLDIEPEMSLVDDLALESIDLVTVNALLAERFGPSVNLAAWLAEKDIDDVIALTVGALADFLESRLAAG